MCLYVQQVEIQSAVDDKLMVILGVMQYIIMNELLFDAGPFDNYLPLNSLALELSFGASISARNPEIAE